MTLCEAIVSMRPDLRQGQEELVRYLFQRCLFDFGGSNAIIAAELQAPQTSTTANDDEDGMVIESEQPQLKGAVTKGQKESFSVDTYD